MDHRPPLHIHLLAHPKSETATKLAANLMRRFVEPPASGGLRIPVFFTPDRGDDFPPAIDTEDGLNLDAAQHSIVVLLADTRMVRTIPSGTGDHWIAFAQRAIELTPLNRSPHHILPVALEKGGFRISEELHILPALLEEASSEAASDRRLAEVSFHIAARAIQLLAHGKVPEIAPDRMKAPVTIFLSHAKADLDKKFHDDPVQRTRALLDQLPVEQWFDAQQIATSQKFADAIAAGIRDCSVMLAFQTDQYSSRPWCRREVLEAKRGGAHVLVVDALQSGEPRSFPYGGNVPTVRWQFRDAPLVDAWQVIDRAVLEALRFKHNHAVLSVSAEAGETVLPAPPEALTLAHQCGEVDVEKVFLYPDPPLGREELLVLQQLRPKALFVTPLTKVARWQRPSHIETITVSISESDDLPTYGLSTAHMATLTDEIHLYLLLAGLKIAYGGALKGTLSGAPNFTLRLLDLVGTYSKLAEGCNTAPMERAVLNVAPWPLHLSYNEDDWNLLNQDKRVDGKEGPRPDLPWTDDELFPPTDKGRPLGSDTPQRRYAWARGLTAMRLHITELSQARLVIGGKLRGYAGVLPGVIEETWLSLKQKRPLYVIGGYGGAARAVSDLLQGRPRPEFTDDWVRTNVPDYDAVRSLYAKHGGDTLSMAQIGEDIAACATAGLAQTLNNGLNEAENQELMCCSDAQRIARLVLTGLGEL